MNYNIAPTLTINPNSYWYSEPSDDKNSVEELVYVVYNTSVLHNFSITYQEIVFNHNISYTLISSYNIYYPETVTITINNFSQTFNVNNHNLLQFYTFNKPVIIYSNQKIKVKFNGKQNKDPIDNKYYIGINNFTCYGTQINYDLIDNKIIRTPINIWKERYNNIIFSRLILNIIDFY